MTVLKTVAVSGMEKSGYWDHFKRGKQLQESGDNKQAASSFELAWQENDEARIGAGFEISLDDIAHARFQKLDVLHEAASQALKSSQKRWYYSNLLMLKAISSINLNEFNEAEVCLAEAYDYRTDINETQFRFPWLQSKIAQCNFDDERMPCLSYLQKVALINVANVNYQDELKALTGDVIFLEIGANDGVKTDPLRAHIVDNRWGGYLVEPVAASFARLCENYKHYPNVVCINAAITNTTGPVQMNYIDPAKMGVDGLDASWAEGVSSINDSGSLRFYSEHLLQETVDGMTFEELVDRYKITNFDILQIDTEGHDYEIFKQIDLSKFKCKIVQIEMNHLKPADRLAAFTKLRDACFVSSYDGFDMTAVLRS